LGGEYGKRLVNPGDPGGISKVGRSLSKRGGNLGGLEIEDDSRVSTESSRDRIFVGEARKVRPRRWESKRKHLENLEEKGIRQGLYFKIIGKGRENNKKERFQTESHSVNSLDLRDHNKKGKEK